MVVISLLCSQYFEVGLLCNVGVLEVRIWPHIQIYANLFSNYFTFAKEINYFPYFLYFCLW